MILAIIIVVGYVVPVIILRHLIRKLAIITTEGPEVAELVVNFAPVLNIIGIPLIYSEIRQRQRRRTVPQLFYNIPKDAETNRGDTE